MKPGLLFIKLALCVTLTLAFYPFQPSWLKEQVKARSVQTVANEHDNGAVAARGVTFEIERSKLARNSASEATKQGARRVIRKYGEPRSAQANTNGAVVKRDNRYKVQEAVDPKQPMTAGISQDGTDYAYFVKVQLGSKRQQLYMLLDTGAGSSWVMGPTCTDAACSKHDTFGSAQSTSFHAIEKEFSVSYGTEAVRGKLASDMITVAGATFDYTFGLASSTSDTFTSFPFDGILGLSMSRGSNDNFLEKLTAAHKLDKNMFCVALNRAADGQNKGEIKFGATNPEKFTGAITYTPLSSKDGEWAIQMDDVAFDGKKAGVGGVKSYIDTGNSLIFGPQDKVAKIHSLIPGANSSTGQTYTVPCDTEKPLTFTFSGVDYKVYPQDWISLKNAAGECTSNVYGNDVAMGSWLIGDTFLMNVYAVFDMDQKRIGFANRAGSGPTPSASSGSGASKTSISPGSSGTATRVMKAEQSGIPAGGATEQKASLGIEVAKPTETSKSAAAVKSFPVTAALMAGVVVAMAV